MRAERGLSGLVALSVALALAGCGGGGGDDGGGNSSPQNRNPTANAGADQTAKVNATVALDGTASADADGDSLSYRWTQTGGMTVVLSSSTSARPTFVAPGQPDSLTFALTTNDGKADSTTDSVIVTVIADSSPVISAQTPPPTAVNYGDTASFKVAATDADGDAIPGFEVAYGPAGFSVTPEGNVSWTPTGPLFDRETEFKWGVRVTGVPSALLTGTIKLTDAAREYPLVRTNLSIPIPDTGLRIADLDGDGTSEMLVGSAQAVYVLSKNRSTYQQSWAYPFDVGTPENGVHDLQAVTSADIDGDGKQEIYFSKNAQLVRLDGVTRRAAASAELRCRALEMADLDGNGTRELVCLDSASDSQSEINGRIVVLNPGTLAEIWSTPQLEVGRSMAVGNVDGDATLEIVTSGGLVFDSGTHEAQWTYNAPFGAAVDTGDMDGDGIEEIIAMVEWSAVRAFSAVSQSQLWEYIPTYPGLDAILVADANGDGRVEAIAGNYQGERMMGIGYNTTTHQPELVWQTATVDAGVSSIAVGDVDADGTNEVVWGTGSSTTGRDQIVIAGFTPTISLKWRSNEIPELDGPFHGGELARIGAGATRLMFSTPRSDSDYSGTRAVALSPVTGEVEASDELGDGSGVPAAITVADYDHDDIDELFIGMTDTYDGNFGAYDFAARSLEWQSPQFSQSAAVAKQADMNGDGYADLVGLTGNPMGWSDVEASVEVYDVHAQALIWRSPPISRSVALALSDLDNDGKQEIVVALLDRLVIYGQNSTATAYVERASNAFPNSTDLAVADLDGDSKPEIYVLGSTGNGNQTLNAFDVDLQPIRSVPLSVRATALYVEQSAFARKNLLLAVAHRTRQAYPALSHAELWAIDPVSGTDVWRSPILLGTVPLNSLHFVDVDGDGDGEIVLGTTYGMYHTR